MTEQVDTTRWIQQGPLPLEALLAETDDPECGGLVVFGGTIRKENHGKRVTRIRYDVHPPLAARTLADLEAEVLERFPVRHCRLQHRVGTLELGECSVWVVVRAKHRAEAFEASRYAIDQLKRRAPIWKEEFYEDGTSEFLKGCSLVDGHHEH